MQFLKYRTLAFQNDYFFVVTTLSRKEIMEIPRIQDFKNMIFLLETTDNLVSGHVESNKVNSNERFNNCCCFLPRHILSYHTLTPCLWSWMPLWSILPPFLLSCYSLRYYYITYVHYVGKMVHLVWMYKTNGTLGNKSFIFQTIYSRTFFKISRTSPYAFSTWITRIIFLKKRSFQMEPSSKLGWKALSMTCTSLKLCFISIPGKFCF